MLIRLNKILFLLAIFLFLIPATNAILNISVQEKGTDFITWNWDYNYNITELSIDGFTVYYFDVNSSSFTLSELDSESSHFIKIYTPTDEGFSNTTTLQSNNSKLAEIAAYYIYFIIAMACLIISIAIKSPMVGFMGTVIMAISFIYNVIPFFYTGNGTMDMVIYGFGLMVSAVIGLALWR